MADRTQLINETKALLPAPFYYNVPDEKVGLYLDLVIGDFNLFPPETYYTIESLPLNYVPLVKFGACLFAQLFWQMGASLQDFTFSDQGVSFTVDQTTRLEAPIRNFLERYKNMVLNAKRNEVLKVQPAGLATPRYQTAIGQFLKMALGSAFVWNAP